MQAGMLTGRAIFGGGALLLDARIGPQATLVMLIAAIWGSLGVLAWLGDAEPERTATVAARRREVMAAVVEVLRRRQTWMVLGFAAIGGAGFEAVGLLVGPYLLDRGFSQEQIGAFLFLPTVAAMIAGAGAAGLLADRIDRRYAAGGSLVAMAATIVALAGAGAAPGWVILALLVLMYFLIGAMTTASYTLFMDLTDPRLGATQLSAAMSATNLCESWSAFAVGRLTQSLGYGPAFTWMAVASLLALPLLAGLPKPARSG
jgi:predicted MFS family arabinose efflux permease